MREPLHKYQEDFVLLFVTEIIERIKPDVLVSPSDLFYWFRPVIEEFQKRGVSSRRAGQRRDVGSWRTHFSPREPRTRALSPDGRSISAVESIASGFFTVCWAFRKNEL